MEHILQTPTITRKSRSILEEISTYVPQRNREDLLESRAMHIISSAINLLESIDDNYDAQGAELLRNRFLSSIRGADPERFTRAISRFK